MEFPKRKPNRLKAYDYSSVGAYFITICTKNHITLLWEHTVGANCVRPSEKMHLSSVGMIIESEIQKINRVYPNVLVDKYVIMPNHIHFLIFILPDKDGRTLFAPTISRVIKQFKGSVTKKIGQPIWQKSFHDRIIRNKKEYQKIWEYIETNPLRWEEDCFYRQES